MDLERRKLGKIAIFCTFYFFEFSIKHQLFGRIDPSQSEVKLGERKVEIVLKQATQSSWPRLNFNLNQEEAA